MKTKCKCGICGKEITGNCKWETEHKMWNHVKFEHPADYAQFQAEKERLQKMINELQKQMPSLYTTEYQGTVRKGSWTI